MIQPRCVFFQPQCWTRLLPPLRGSSRPFWSRYGLFVPIVVAFLPLLIHVLSSFEQVSVHDSLSTVLATALQQVAPSAFSSAEPPPSRLRLYDPVKNLATAPLESTDPACTLAAWSGDDGRPCARTQALVLEPASWDAVSHTWRFPAWLPGSLAVSVFLLLPGRAAYEVGWFWFRSLRASTLSSGDRGNCSGRGR